MRYLDLRQKLSDQLVFTVSDIKKFDPQFYYSRLTEWQEKGYIKKVCKSFYIFADAELDEVALFAISNQIYSPSYISLESALNYYNLIPEGVFAITAVTTKQPYEISTDIVHFDYRKIRQDLFFGYKVVGEGDRKFKIASPEKTLLDTLYLNSDLSSREAIESLRLNKSVVRELVDQEKFERFERIYQNQSLQKRAGLLMETILNA